MSTSNQARCTRSLGTAGSRREVCRCCCRMRPAAPREKHSHAPRNWRSSFGAADNTLALSPETKRPRQQGQNLCRHGSGPTETEMHAHECGCSPRRPATPLPHTHHTVPYVHTTFCPHDSSFAPTPARERQSSGKHKPPLLVNTCHGSLLLRRVRQQQPNTSKQNLGPRQAPTLQ
jgi:hypothetical protein